MNNILHGRLAIRTCNLIGIGDMYYSVASLDNGRIVSPYFASGCAIDKQRILRDLGKLSKPEIKEVKAILKETFVD
jgi:hypothetical protein